MGTIDRWLPFGVLVGALLLTTLAIIDRHPPLDVAATATLPAGTGRTIGTGPSAPGEAATGNPRSTALGAGTPDAGPVGETRAGTVSGRIGSAGAAGTTSVAGVLCGTGIPQVPESRYAVPCTPAFTGDNGGSTYAGVTADTIRVVVRRFPDGPASVAAASFTAEAGGADAETNRAVRDVFVEYFNDMFETYGRRVELIDYEAQGGDALSENYGNAREKACVDAANIRETIDPMFVISEGIIGTSAVFSECAAEQGMVVLDGAFYTENAVYERLHPFVFNLSPDCDRVATLAGEYIGKRLAGRPAVHAGDPTMQTAERAFGLYVPDRDDFQACAARAIAEMESRYGLTLTSRYDYALDLSRLADQAQRGMTQFRADGVNNVLMFADPLSAVFMTRAATNQAYFPEWFVSGVALTDVDAIARLYDQTAVDGHLFGMSFLGDTGAILSPDGEPGRVYRQATGSDIPQGATGAYAKVVMLFDAIQLAGPVLTPSTVADGLRAMPDLGAPDFQLGRWSFGHSADGSPGVGDHTGLDDAREVYWSFDTTGSDGKQGTFLTTYGGSRFGPGQWPAGEPAVYGEG